MGDRHRREGTVGSQNDPVHARRVRHYLDHHGGRARHALATVQRRAPVLAAHSRGKELGDGVGHSLGLGRLLARGGQVFDKSSQPPNPCSDWIGETAWDHITELDKLAAEITERLAYVAQ